MKTHEQSKICPICGKIVEGPTGSMARHVRWEHKGVKVKVETRVKSPSLVTADDIADALLRKVMNWLSEKETYSEQISRVKELRNTNVRLTEELRCIREERDRLLKIHNEHIVRNNNISTQELINLAKK